MQYDEKSINQIHSYLEWNHQYKLASTQEFHEIFAKNFKQLPAHIYQFEQEPSISNKKTSLWQDNDWTILHRIANCFVLIKIAARNATF